MKKNTITKKQKTPLEVYRSERITVELFKNEQGIPSLQSISLGGKKLSLEDMKNSDTLNAFFNSMAEIGGGLDPSSTLDFITDVASHLPEGLNQSTFDRALLLLQKMKPSDPVEARLLAQHFVLNEQGLKYLNLCNKTDRLDHSQHYGTLAMKMLRLSQESILALVKYRNKGTQQINIVHMQDNAKAVMMGGGIEKSSNEPHGSL